MRAPVRRAHTFAGAGRGGASGPPPAPKPRSTHSSGSWRGCRYLQRLGSDVEADLQAVGDSMRPVDEERSRRSRTDGRDRLLEEPEPSLEMLRRKTETLMSDMWL